MVDLVRAGRNPDDLAREFEPSGHSIRAWVAQADRNEGRREDAAPGLTAFERDELTRLPRAEPARADSDCRATLHRNVDVVFRFAPKAPSQPRQFALVSALHVQSAFTSAPVCTRQRAPRRMLAGGPKGRTH